MGVHEMGLRKSIMRAIEGFKVKQAEERAAAKAKGIEGNEASVVPATCLQLVTRFTRVELVDIMYNILLLAYC